MLPLDFLHNTLLGKKVCLTTRRGDRYVGTLLSIDENANFVLGDAVIPAMEDGPNTTVINGKTVCFVHRSS